MKLSAKKPAFSLNKAFRKVKPHRDDFERFRKNLKRLLEHSSENKFEDFNKSLAADFLKETYYSPSYFINIKERNDQVIHTGANPDSNVGVIIEAKAPSNKSEMISRDNANVKALHELMLYFLRERITHENKEIKYLIATNSYEWFVFDAQQFEKAFSQNKKFVQQFKDFEAGRLSGSNTEFFYKEIAKPYVASLSNALECTWFDLREYQLLLEKSDDKSERKLISLYKIFSPEHLLKLPFANDSNSLDQNFYKELLHIIGLEETKVKGKKLIGRKEKGDRNPGSLLENAIDHIDSLDKLSRVTNSKSFGETREERLFGVALELCITWMNRILFLKLLEAQLISYAKGDKSIGFLNTNRIKDFDVLNDLFFQVLARKYEDRSERIQTEFGIVPYLNSSLFDPTELEHEALFISNLRDDMTLPLLSQTVLKGEGGKRQKGEMSTIAYLFEFLDAYDFTSEGSEDIQEESKTLINASVLGLIFEKINGYKDGSFFTPGFITMYMCRETIRRAVMQKFNETKGWSCENFDELYDKIEDRTEANQIINSLKICDPAVGSGHFLVSALNEILTIKYELRILQDRNGKWLKEYELEVVNDELVISVEDELFEYHPNSPESQRVQEALFHEKQTIIENCLFGVDINPNSVKICRLRLWIELLKHAYFKTNDSVIPRRKPGSGLAGSPRSSHAELSGRHAELDSASELTGSPTQTPDQDRGDDGIGNGKQVRHLETLPNIDINIKTGNSLISRFALDADLKDALKKSKWSIDSYRVAVHSYRNARNKDEKREMLQLMDDIKGDFRTEIQRNAPEVVKLKKLSDELVVHTTQTSMFDQTVKEKKVWKTTTEKLTKAIGKLETEIEEIKNNQIYENAFEWRFEFPEVLSDDGDFIGFDVVIGNPPYGSIFTKTEKIFIKESFNYTDYQYDIYMTFIELSKKLLSDNSYMSYIIPNTWLLNLKSPNIRKLMFNQFSIQGIQVYDFPVFDEAIVDTLIVIAQNKLLLEGELMVSITDKNEHSIINYFDREYLRKSYKEPLNIYLSKFALGIQRKLSHLKKLDQIAVITQGTKPFQKGKGKPKQTSNTLREKPFVQEEKKDQTFRPLLRGSLMNRYVILWANNYYISYGDWLAEPRYSANFDASKKIIIRQTGSSLLATIDYDQFVVRDNLYTIVSKKNSYSEEVILGLLNSTLLNWYYQYIINYEVGEALAQVKRGHLEILPIPIMNLSNFNKIESKVTQILALKKENPQADTSVLEEEIDQMVYELYGLTEEEIAIVEGSVGIRN